jgi:hypothetical protein
MKDALKKLKFKANGVVINAPASLAKEFESLGFSTTMSKSVRSENTLLFINNKEEALNLLTTFLKSIVFDSVFWIAYPKGTSKIKTDINRDSLRILAEEFGITTVTAVSIDDTWSALRFRPVDKVGK